MEAECFPSEIEYCCSQNRTSSGAVVQYIIDSNLLVLLVVGRVNHSLVGRHRRLKQFVPEDFDRLVEVLTGADRILVTPNTLTEASNLLAYQRGPERARLSEELRRLIEREIEIVVPSVVAATRSEFRRLGLTDAALIEAASDERQLLTADLKLFRAALSSDARAAVYFRVANQG